MAVTIRGGAAQFWVNGVFYDLAGDLKVKVGGLTPSEMAMGPSGVAGYIQKWMEPEVSGDIYDSGTLSVTKLKQILQGANVQVNCNNGKSYMLYDAVILGDPEIDLVSGKIPLKLSGTRCQELPAS